MLKGHVLFCFWDTELEWEQEIECAPVHWFTSQMFAIGGGQSWELEPRTQSRYPAYVAPNQLFQPSLMTSMNRNKAFLMWEKGIQKPTLGFSFKICFYFYLYLKFLKYVVQFHTDWSHFQSLTEVVESQRCFMKIAEINFTDDCASKYRQILW